MSNWHSDRYTDDELEKYYRDEYEEEKKSKSRRNNALAALAAFVSLTGLGGGLISWLRDDNEEQIKV